MYGNLLEKFEKDLYDNADKIAALPDLDITMLESSETVLVIMNMTNQYLKNSSDAYHDIIGIVEPVKNILELCSSRNIKSIVFRDAHDENSTEFSYLPKHSLISSDESNVMKELSDTGGYTVIDKNSINAFHAPGFKNFLAENKNIKNYIVCGTETDISVMNFCLTLKSYYDECNTDVNIIVPYTAIETFDYGAHNNDISNVLAIVHMASQGIEIVKEIV
ncbi:MAG: isochorismatase family cysteine hydrolase [Oscillospiraceae bacterium]|nr:isochorismatase family cysteine hydrolase [Oscillospiraceae bacterium]